MPAGWAQSFAGPTLVGLGLLGLACASVVHGAAGKPTLWTTRDASATERPSVWERLSVHLVAAGAWSLFFGYFVWRGPAVPAWDVRLPGEATWPVWAASEWVYVTGYLTPLVVAWLAPTRGALRRLCVRLGMLSVVSGLCFWLLPIVSPPRAWDAEAGGITTRLLAWELGRADFGAVSLPSFHVVWAMLLASVVAERGRAWKVAGWGLAVAMSAACVLNGAHAVLDVAASWVLWPVVNWAMNRCSQSHGIFARGTTGGGRGWGGRKADGRTAILEHRDSSSAVASEACRTSIREG